MIAGLVHIEKATWKIMESHGHRFIVDDYPARKFGDFPVRYVVTFARPGKPLDFKEAYFQTNPMWLERVSMILGQSACLLSAEETCPES